MTVHRQGIGNVLTEGVTRVLKIIGKDSVYYIPHVKEFKVSAHGANHLRPLTTLDKPGAIEI
ncbi:MAG: hypothetical protein QXV81_05735 [Ignisphaera sp.]|uniref:Uncharacterized protein n=1 Tax=Ignisphaera aggregans TaxID=334771 RepID=A0A7J3I8G0_9CREN